MTRIRWVVCLLVWGLADTSSFAQHTQDQVLVRFKDGQPQAGRAVRAAGLVHGNVARTFDGGKYAVIQMPKSSSVAAAAKQLQHSPEIEAAAPNFTRRIIAVPDDPQFHTHQWALNSTGQTISFPSPAPSVLDADIDAPEAWDITTGSANVVVAVIDTGIGLTNPDLSQNVWVNDNEIPDNGIDDDGNGYVDDLNGYDFSSRTPSPSDDQGHGSFVSGIIGARGNNGTGISGVNWRVSLMALKTFNAQGTGTDADIIEALAYAVDNGAKVINASWGDPAYSAVLLGAIRDVGDAGVLLVAAAGNDGNNLREHPFYPAAFSLPNLVTVGSTNYQDKWSPFSNYDNTMVDIFAPGEGVYSSRQTSFGFGNGTSYAAPHVVGLAALLLAQDPLLSPEEMRRYLISAADQRQPLDKRAQSDGRISAYKALASHIADTTAPSAITNLTFVQADNTALRFYFWPPSGDDGNAGVPLFYDARISTAPIIDSNFYQQQRLPFVRRPADTDSLVTLYATALEPNTQYHVRVVAIDDAGNTSPLSNEATGTTFNTAAAFTENMDSGSSQWTASGGFARTTETVHSGTHAWTESPVGNYARGQTAMLTSMPFSLNGYTNPWVRFYHQYIFENSSTTHVDGGELQISANGGPYTTLARFYDWHQPWTMENISLFDYGMASSVRLRFRFHSDSAANEYDGWVIDDVQVYQRGQAVPETPVFVTEAWSRFEMTTGPLYTESTAGGAWVNDSSKAVHADLRAANSRYNVTDVLGSSATFVPYFSREGVYQVEAIWGPDANATHVRYRISHAGNTNDFYLDQDGATTSSQWVSLGFHPFFGGRSAQYGSVTIDESTVTGKPDAAKEGRVYVDGLRFTYFGPSPAAVKEWDEY